MWEENMQTNSTQTDPGALGYTTHCITIYIYINTVDKPIMDNKNKNVLFSIYVLENRSA